MANYVDASTQTVWAGLTKNPVVRAETLYTAPDTTTPPEEMITDKPQTLDMLPSGMQPRLHPATASLLQRRARPELATRVSLPSELDVKVAPTPPPTNAVLSPLPDANRLHAGHTPRRLRALSPLRGEEAHSAEGVSVEGEQTTCQDPAQEYQSYTPEDDVGLKGPLSLPALPTKLMDGPHEHIALDALDEELSRIAREQERFSKLRDAPEPAQTQATGDHVPAGQDQESSNNFQDAKAPAPMPTQDETPGDDLPASRTPSLASRKASDDVEAIDGVILRSPPLNFGEPLGQGPRRRSEPDGSAN